MPKFSDIIGQEELKKHIQSAIEMDKVSHAYIINGERNAGKVKKLLDFSSRPRAIADPWYTGEFDVTYDDVLEGCEAFLDYLTTS